MGWFLVASIKDRDFIIRKRDIIWVNEGNHSFMASIHISESLGCTHCDTMMVKWVTPTDLFGENVGFTFWQLKITVQWLGRGDWELVAGMHGLVAGMHGLGAGMHIPYRFPIQWGAKELGKLSLHETQCQQSHTWMKPSLYDVD